MPIWHLGKRREALTGNSEVYKKKILSFLDKRGYYLKADSYVEATFADCILTRKDEPREYWLEAKATTISLGEKDFLTQLSKYLAEYIKRTEENRFKLIIACYAITGLKSFMEIFDSFEPNSIEKLVSQLKQVTDSEIQGIIENAESKDIIGFFEESLIITANPSDLIIAEEKIIPSIPVRPSLPEAEYASQVLHKFEVIEPQISDDILQLNLFTLSLPSILNIGKTPYPNAKTMFYEKPHTTFPPFILDNGRMYSFWGMDEKSLLGKFVYPQSVTTVKLDDFTGEKNERLINWLLNQWIRNECRRLGLKFDKRTRAYYFERKGEDEIPITVSWKPKTRISRRELTKPMLKDGDVNYWIHRAVEISAKKFWGNHYLQIRPRWLFSPDGIHLLDGVKAARLDKAFRKSIYNRNLNQLYDVLFWYRYIFSETDVMGNLRLDNMMRRGTEHLIKVKDQVSLKFDRIPNVEVAEEVEKLDIIELESLSLLTRSLDEFM